MHDTALNISKPGYLAEMAWTALFPGVVSYHRCPLSRKEGLLSRSSASKPVAVMAV